MPHSLAGAIPAQVAASHGPGISLAGIPVTECLMRRHERKRGAKVTGQADPEGVKSRNDRVGELADGFLSRAGYSGCRDQASGSNHPGI